MTLREARTFAAAHGGAQATIWPALLVPDWVRRLTQRGHSSRLFFCCPRKPALARTAEDARPLSSPHKSVLKLLRHRSAADLQRTACALALKACASPTGVAPQQVRPQRTPA